MKKLKTGDVKRIRVDETWNLWPDSKWLTIGGLDGIKTWAFFSRQYARFGKLRNERIARILSIGPKYVTVRISK